MCSTGGADLARICLAIEELAGRPGSGGDDNDEAARLARLAAIWVMVAEADPELARRLPGYLTAPE